MFAKRTRSESFFAVVSAVLLNTLVTVGGIVFSIRMGSGYNVSAQDAIALTGAFSILTVFFFGVITAALGADESSLLTFIGRCVCTLVSGAASVAAVLVTATWLLV